MRFPLPRARRSPRWLPAPTGARILVIGNCQGAVMARLMRLLRPDLRVAFRSTGRLIGPGHGSIGRRYDHVFAQPPPPRHAGVATFEALAERHPGFIALPNLVFAAFHPDLIYVGGDRGFVSSAIGHYNSALTLYAFLAGCTPDDALHLFRAEIYEAVGYLNLWEYSAATLLDLGRQTGWELGENLLRWTRRGLFMHSTNHPRAFVLADMAAAALTRAGLPAEAADVEHYYVDELMLQGSWPVYPPIAQRYGVPGSHLFLEQRLGAARRLPSRTLRLETFVTESFRLYAKTPRERLRSDRVDTWLASADMARLLRPGRP